MSTQSLLVIIIYSICLLIALITSIVKKTINSSEIFGFILSFLYVILLAYDTNCLTEGQCGTWSWIRTILYLIFPTIILVLFMIRIFKKDKVDEKKVETTPVKTTTTSETTTSTPVKTTTTSQTTTTTPAKTTTTSTTPVANTTNKEGFFQTEYESVEY